MPKERAYKRKRYFPYKMCNKRKRYSEIQERMILEEIKRRKRIAQPNSISSKKSIISSSRINVGDGLYTYRDCSLVNTVRNKTIQQDDLNDVVDINDLLVSYEKFELLYEGTSEGTSFFPKEENKHNVFIRRIWNSLYIEQPKDLLHPISSLSKYLQYLPLSTEFDYPFITYMNPPLIRPFRHLYYNYPEFIVLTPYK